MSADFLAGGGVFRGASPAPMGTGLSRVLGSQGGSLPGVADAPGIVQPVGVVYDTSNELSRALQPRRWMAGAFQILGGVAVLKWRIRAPANASIVVEYLRVRGPAGAELTGTIGCNVSTGDVFVGFAMVAQGGIAIGGSVPGGPVSPSPPVGSGVSTNTADPHLGFGAIEVPPWTFDGPTLIFLPPGGSFGFETATGAEDVGWSVRWREIPE